MLIRWAAYNASIALSVFLVTFHYPLKCCPFIVLPVILSRLSSTKAHRHFLSPLKEREHFEKYESNKLSESNSNSSVVCNLVLWQERMSFRSAFGGSCALAMVIGYKYACPHPPTHTPTHTH